MSFILDALKKSENERQQQATAEFSSVPQARDTPAAPRWIWMLGVLLAINVVVVAGLLLREGESVAPVERPAGLDSSASPVGGASEIDSFERRVAVARQNLPQRPAPGPEPRREPVVAERTAPTVPTPSPELPANAGTSATLPSLDELRADGTLQLPDLHIDLHVYNETPARRFASINAQKVREQETLAEGPRVREITRDGVILVYQGKPFIVRK